MANKSNTTPQNNVLARITRTEAYANKVRMMFDATVARIIELNKRLPDIPDDEMFSFDAQTEKVRDEVERALRQLYAAANHAIEQGIQVEWNAANAAADKLVQSQFGKRALSSPEFAGWTQRNGAAMRQFIERSERGMNLSQRVWKATRQLRDEMEVAITVAVGDGTSAQSMSRQIRMYLNDPDLMFRRFRYKDPDTGEWRRKWKKRVIDPNTGKVTFIDYDKDSYRDQWTGRGYYKSAAMNAMRVARTETNIAYRRADHERMNQLDFVIGQRVKLSRSHPEIDICDKLAGDYPKDFVFDGWHPQCFCHVESILLDDDLFDAAMDADNWREEIKRLSDQHQIKDYPDGFQSWVKDNADKITAARERGTEPYFIRNNAGVVDGILNPKAKSASHENALSQNAHDLINHLQANGNLEESFREGSLSDNEIYRKWDTLSESERLAVLERGKYTGMLTSEDDLDFCNLYQSTSRESMVGTLQDELMNKRDGYDTEDTNHYIIKFKGNDKVVYSYDLEKPLTKAELKKVEYISANNGMSNYRYWCADDDAKRHMMREMGFIEYRDGVVVDSWNGKDFTGKPIGAAAPVKRTPEDIERIQDLHRIEGLLPNMQNTKLKDYITSNIADAKNAAINGDFGLLNKMKTEIETYVTDVWMNTYMNRSTAMQTQSAAFNNACERWFTAMNDNDIIGAYNELMNVRKKGIQLTRWNLRNWDYIDKTFTFEGLQPDYKIFGGGEFTTRHGTKVKVDKLQDDLLKFTDKNGVAYYYPMGVEKSNIRYSALKASKEFGAYPKYMRENLGEGIIFSDRYHPMDAFFQKDYASFTHGAMYSGNPITVHHDYTSDSEGFKFGMCHEIGHHIDTHTLWRNNATAQAAWKEAQIKDGAFYRDYGKNAPTEDFADSVSLWVNKGEEWFTSQFPNRAALLKAILSSL